MMREVKLVCTDCDHRFSIAVSLLLTQTLLQAHLDNGEESCPECEDDAIELVPESSEVAKDAPASQETFEEVAEVLERLQACEHVTSVQAVQVQAWIQQLRAFQGRNEADVLDGTFVPWTHEEIQSLGSNRARAELQLI